VLVATNHSAYDWPMIVAQARLIVDTRGATAKLGGRRDHIVQA
jgi:UDP-N-acetyl-D-mannosaminuronate dehydrogenase